MKATQLREGWSYELKGQLQGIYRGYDSDPAQRHKPYIFEVPAKGGLEFHLALKDVHGTWEAYELQREDEARRVELRASNESFLMGFLEHHGLSPSRRSMFTGVDGDMCVRVAAEEDLGKSQVEMTVDGLLTLLMAKDAGAALVAKARDLSKRDGDGTAEAEATTSDDLVTTTEKAAK